LKACVKCGKEYQDTTLQACPDDSTNLVDLSSDLPEGTVLGDRYEVIEVIADGGMGKIYKAKHRLINKYVAVKTILPNMVMSGAILKRFQQEADAISKLSHPNILSVTDFFVSQDGHPYLVTDYLRGDSLQQVLDRDGPMNETRAMNIFRQMCAALKHAHIHGIIHRDLKPSNVMLVKQDDQEDVVKIIDFGIAKIVRDEDKKTVLTETGDVFGSPPYMSPEQCRGRPLDPTSDIYSLGCVLYAMLTGHPPFVCSDDVEYMFKHVHEAAPALPVDTSANVANAFTKMLAKEPQDRFQSINELIYYLQGPVVSTAIQPVAAPIVGAPNKLLMPMIGGGAALLIIGSISIYFTSHNTTYSKMPDQASKFMPEPPPPPVAVTPVPVAPVKQTPDEIFSEEMQKGKDFYSAQHFHHAQESFKAAHDVAFGFGEEDPRFVTSLEWQANTAAKLGNYTEAIQALQFVIHVRKMAGKPAAVKEAEKELATVKGMLRRLDSN
jgi:serine/threonine protein kinase